MASFETWTNQCESVWSDGVKRSCSAIGSAVASSFGAPSEATQALLVLATATFGIPYAAVSCRRKFMCATMP
eukprot:3391196-Amphidinium_carterae.1